MHWRRKWQSTPVFLPEESQGWGVLVGCHLWGHTESDMTEAIWQQQQQQVQDLGNLMVQFKTPLAAWRLSRLMVQKSEGSLLENSLLLQETRCFVLFRPSTDWLRPTHIVEGNLLT